MLVANAGAGESAPIAKMSDERWSRQLELNLTAPFRCVRRVVPHMVESGWGRIVVVASLAAKRGEPYLGAYVASKHGVLGLTRSVAAELAKTGVTANAVCPAYVDTADDRRRGRDDRADDRAQPRGGPARPRERPAERSADHCRRGRRGGLVLRGQQRGQRAGHQRRRRRHPVVSDAADLSRVATAPDQTLHYGDLPDHVVDLRLPSTDAARPLVVVVHGGFWKAEYDRAHAGPQSAGLAHAGYVVATVDYRRVGQAGGGWPGTFDDLAALTDAVPSLVAAALPGRVDTTHTVLVGHSAGAHLAAWAAARHRLPEESPWHRAAPLDLPVVSLAGVLDLEQSDRLGPRRARGPEAARRQPASTPRPLCGREPRCPAAHRRAAGGGARQPRRHRAGRDERAVRRPGPHRR